MKYFYDFDSMEKFKFGPDVTSSFGSKVHGKKMVFGMAEKKPGTGSKPHRHNAEQFNYMMKGRARAVVGGEEKIIGPGEVVYIPADVVHSIVALDEDVVFLTVKEVPEAFEVVVEGEIETTDRA
ncbi:cupin domain-containing protein [Acuticoccus kandeliae]|uniref:cupin domain-containing protein n=1 Tax=Acuticoccus kandeliae TaxID=2073160 RepID=UPI000D3E8814|nr:cupin domain-containing protein [Acuticoccus kandeliae]